MRSSSFSALYPFIPLLIIFAYGCTAGTVNQVKGPDTVALLVEGKAAHEKGQYDRAIAYYDEAIKIDPSFAAAYHSRGKAYNRKQQHDQAISDCTNAIALTPNYADAYLTRGAAYLAKKNYDAAISDISKAIELNPKDAYAYNLRGACYAGKGEFKRAISDFTKVIELYPKSLYAHHNRAVAYANTFQYVKACADYKRQCELFGHCENYEYAKKEYFCDYVGELGTKGNPVKCDRPSGQREYIMRLRCPGGDEPEFRRIGSYGFGPYGHMLDGYELTCKKDNLKSFIYMDMYHEGHRETNPVPGFTVLPELPALIAKGCPPRVPGYKPGTYIFRLMEVKYPPCPKSEIEDAVDIGMKGRVYVEVIIDEHGHVATDKVKFLYSSDLLLQEHAIQYLSDILFEPAEHHQNCKVPVIVKFGIDFK